MNACTIIARNYLAHARVLADSFFEHHPEGVFWVLVLDDLEEQVDEAEEGFRVLRPADIMEPKEFHVMATIYDVMELATAVKPWFLRYLLDSGAAEAIYLDPDIQIFAPLDDIASLAQEHGIVLIPHTTEPMPRDDRGPSELYVLQSGVYNLGFIAVGKGTENFLDWWSERLRRDCVVAPERGLFVDQRWIDFVPGYFDHYILRDPACNVAYWNLSSREVRWTGDHYEVNGEPLRFFHFSGFDPDRPHLLSKHQGKRPRILLSERPHLARLCREYGEALIDRGYREAHRLRYSLEVLPNGISLDRWMRRCYRDALVAAEREDGEPPPNPFDDPEDFLKWLNEPVLTSASGASLSRYLYAIYEGREDLQGVFPDLTGPDLEGYFEWVLISGIAEERIPSALLPDEVRPVKVRDRSRQTGATPMRGFNVVGYFRAIHGVGEAARRLIAAIEAAGIPYVTVGYQGVADRQGSGSAWRSEILYDTNIVCVNADMLPSFAQHVGPSFFEGRYTIGMWFWEVPEFPERWRSSFDYVDEVWTGSHYSTEAVAAVSPKPVLTFPLPVSLPSGPPPMTRADLGLPDRFLYLFSFDFLSVFERKNPLALVRAFERAFEPEEGPILVIKSINGDKRLDQLEELRVAAAGRPDIVVWDEYLSPEAKDALMSTCDCYVSLHRAEGFGLTMAEAMASGKPVIATGHSGNMMYMTPENSYPVPFTMTSVPEGCDPYPAGSTWADPDIEEAARLLRHVYDHPDEARERGLRARRDIETKHTPEVRGEWLRERMSVLGGTMACSRTSAVLSHKTEESSAKGERVISAAESPASFQWTDGSKFGWPIKAARSLLARLLAPYVERRREVERKLLQAVTEMAERVTALEQDLGLSITEVLRIEEAYEVELEETKKDLERRVGRLEELESEVARSRSRLEQLESGLGEIVDRVAERDAWLESLSQDVNKSEADIRLAVDALQERVADLQTRMGSIVSELRPVPFMTDPEMFEMVSGDGVKTLGYVLDEGAGVDQPLYLGFEKIFRGPEAFIRDRQRVYLDILDGRQPVVDIGCGRGEFLDLLAEAGLQAVGIDLDPEMVEHCRRKGHRVELTDGVAFLADQDDESIGTVFSAQLVEHLAWSDIARLYEVARRKLMSGGLFIAETVNPHCVPAFKTFWVDPTHRTPIFPEVALAVAKLTAYGAARVLFPNGSGEAERDIWEQGEYAVVCRK